MLKLLLTITLFTQTDDLEKLSILRKTAIDSVDNLSFAIKLVDERILLAEKLQNIRAKAGSLYLKGDIYDEHERYYKAIKYYTQSEELYRTVPDHARRLSLIKNIGALYHNLNLFDKAIEIYMNGLMLAESLQNEKYIADFHRYLANTYNENADPINSIKHLFKAEKKYIELNDSIGLAHNYIEAGILFYKSQNLDSSIHYYNKAIQYGNTFIKSKALNNIGNVLILNNKPGESISYLDSAITLNKKNGFNDLLIENFNNKGKAYFALKRLDSAFKYYNKSLLINDLDNLYELVEGYLRYDSIVNISGFENKQKEAQWKKLSRVTIDIMKAKELYENYIYSIQQDYEDRIAEEKIKNAVLGISISLLIILFFVLVLYKYRNYKTIQEEVDLALTKYKNNHLTN